MLELSLVFVTLGIGKSDKRRMKRRTGNGERQRTKKSVYGTSECIFTAGAWPITIVCLSSRRVLPFLRTKFKNFCLFFSDPRIRHLPNIQYFEFSDKLRASKVKRALLWMYIKGRESTSVVGNKITISIYKILDTGKSGCEFLIFNSWF